MSQALYHVGEGLVLASALFASLVFVALRLRPALLSQWRMKAALRLGRPRNPAWRRWLAARIAPPTAVAQGGCGPSGCNSCNHCG